jgi:inhibitor of the pro-sigma K processing machinery
MFELVGLLVALVIVYLILRFLKDPMYVIGNSIMGIVIFFVLNLFGFGIAIDIFSIGIVAIGGIAGVLLVLIFHFLGLAF